MTDVLLLNADYTPLRVVDWQKAVGLVLDKKVQVVAAYAGQIIRSTQLNLPWPAVVVQRRYTRSRGVAPYSRINVIARDGAVCQYCGARPRSRNGRTQWEELTVDHVVPRAQSVAGEVVLPWSGLRVPVTSWENTVTACAKCNRLKGARTPEQAGLTLRALPRRPDEHQLMRLAFTRSASLPPEWRSWIPDDLAATAAMAS